MREITDKELNSSKQRDSITEDIVAKQYDVSTLKPDQHTINTAQITKLQDDLLTSAKQRDELDVSIELKTKQVTLTEEQIIGNE